MKKIESGIDARGTTWRSVMLIMAAATLGLLASTPARADDSVGTVTQVSGSAQIQRGGATLPAQQGTAGEGPRHGDDAAGRFGDFGI